MYWMHVCSASNGNNGNQKAFSSIVKALTVNPADDPDGINVGAELSGQLKKQDLLKLLNQFHTRVPIKIVAKENGIDAKLFHQVFVSFRRFCVESTALPTDLHISLSDILQEAGHVDDLMPYFLQHAKIMFPHLDCMEDLEKISDLTLPANWYTLARTQQRKIIYHAGPTNSGKTYQALQRFTTAKSGVYCGPLRLLANEVFKRTNLNNTPCDLVTGEERRMGREDGEPANHISCTVEMVSVNSEYEVAVIDEIQMMRDYQRGWAWTRAFLGVCAQELHVCGEGTGIKLIKELAMEIGDEVEVRHYKRLTPLTVLDYAVDNFDNIKAGDCIVCFNKNDIYHCSRQLDGRGIEAAVIYGTLPSATKLAQAEKFNDPESPCSVMVATDAIGMGLNLNIKRIVFYSMMKPVVDEKGEKEMNVLPVSLALQIAGRAGRYGTQYADGEVTTFRQGELNLLQEVLKGKVEDIVQAGLHPTADQIELFAFHLPKATLSNLIDIFITVSQLDNKNYFMCKTEDFKFLADMIEHISLPLRARYVFCCAPISQNSPFVCAMFMKFARQFSKAEPMDFDWLCRQVGWPFSTPSIIKDQLHLECVYDVLDLYLWFQYRFPDLFPDAEHVRDMQMELNGTIQEGVTNITKLLRNTETKFSMGTSDEDFVVNRKQRPILQRKSKLTDDLIESGVLTAELVSQIEKELTEDYPMSTQNRRSEHQRTNNSHSTTKGRVRTFLPGKGKTIEGIIMKKTHKKK